MQGMLFLESHIPTWASAQVRDAFTVLKHPCNCLKCGRFIWALANYSCNIKTIHTCIYQGRFAVRYRPFLLFTLTCLCTHKAQCVGVCFCSWTGNDAGAEVTAGHCWHQVRQQISSGCTTQYFGFIMQQMLECAIQVAKADKLNSAYLAQGTSLSYVSGTMCPFVSSAQAPLLNPFVFGVFFCTFVLVFIMLNMSAAIMRDPPPF